MVIRCLVEYMNEELDDAKKYVEAAGGSKDKTLAATYLTLAGEEIDHFTKSSYAKTRPYGAYSFHERGFRRG